MKFNSRLLCVVSLFAIGSPLSGLAADSAPTGTHPHSAKRRSDEDWTQAKARVAATSRTKKATGLAPGQEANAAPNDTGMQEVAVDGMSSPVDTSVGSALGMAKPYQAGFDWVSEFKSIPIPDWSRYDKSIPGWTSADDARYPGLTTPLQKIFAKYRDLWDLSDPNHLDSDGQPLKRRPSWTYGEDGCFMRAAWMGQNIKAAHIMRPAKIFAFGNLKLATPHGTITWWYHVVGLVQYHGAIYALDPSVEANAPLAVADWLDRIAHDELASGKTVLASVCDPGTYYPNSTCDLGSTNIIENLTQITDDQNEFFVDEWNQLGQWGYADSQITQMLDAPITTLPQAEAATPQNPPQANGS